MSNAVIDELMATIDSMVLLAGYATFQPKEGWEWFDMMRKYWPTRAQEHVELARKAKNWK